MHVSREETTPLSIREPYPRSLMALSQRFRSCTGASVLPKSLGPRVLYSSDGKNIPRGALLSGFHWLGAPLCGGKYTAKLTIAIIHGSCWIRLVSADYTWRRDYNAIDMPLRALMRDGSLARRARAGQQGGGFAIGGTGPGPMMHEPSGGVVGISLRPLSKKISAGPFV